MDEKRPFIATYIEASRPFGVVYIGMTSTLYRRGAEHRTGALAGPSRLHSPPPASDPRVKPEDDGRGRSGKRPQVHRLPFSAYPI